MERRDFFKSIAGIFGVAAVAGLPIEAVAEALAPAPVLPIPRQFQELTRFMHQELVRKLRTCGWAFPEVSQVELSKVHFRHFGIDLALKSDELQTRTDEFIKKVYIDPPVAVMVNEIDLMKPRQFYKLPFPSGVDMACVVEGGGLALRGIRDYDIQERQYVTRFDVLCS